MKKLLSLVLALTFVFSLCATALAAEDISQTPTPTNSVKTVKVDGKTYTISDVGVTSDGTTHTFSYVMMPVASNGRLACVKYGDRYDGVKGYNGDIVTSISGIKNGSIARSKTFVKVSLSADGYLGAGSTAILMAYEPIDDTIVASIFAAMGRSGDTAVINVKNIADALIVYTEGKAAVRGVDTGKTLVGRLWLSDGQYINVYAEAYGSWGTRMVVDLCLLNGGNNGGNTGNNGNTGNTGDADFTIGNNGGNTGDADFTIGNNGGNTDNSDNTGNAGTDFTIGGNDTPENTGNTGGNHSGWDAGFGTGSSNSDSTGNSGNTGNTGDAGFTIQ